MKKIFKLFYVVVAVLLTAYLCSYFTQMGLQKWYNDAPKPMLTPPNGVFPIVWIIVYITIAVASYIALRNVKPISEDRVNSLFVLQLLLQIGWCFTFFARGYLGLGMVIIILLDVVVFKMIVVYSQIKRISGILLYPYYWWLVFATFLNVVFVASKGLTVIF